MPSQCLIVSVPPSVFLTLTNCVGQSLREAWNLSPYDPIHNAFVCRKLMMNCCCFRTRACRENIAHKRLWWESTPDWGKRWVEDLPEMWIAFPNLHEAPCHWGAQLFARFCQNVEALTFPSHILCLGNFDLWICAVVTTWMFIPNWTCLSFGKKIRYHSFLPRGPLLSVVTIGSF